MIVADRGAVPHSRAAAFIKGVVQDEIRIIHEATDGCDIKSERLRVAAGGIGHSHDEARTRRCCWSAAEHTAQ